VRKPKNAPTADPLNQMVDREIAELVHRANVAGSLTAATSADAGVLSPMESAILSIDQDVRKLLDLVVELGRRVEEIESLASDLRNDRVRQAMANLRKREGLER
jgi:hypothetical protein